LGERKEARSKQDIVAGALLPAESKGGVLKHSRTNWRRKSGRFKELVMDSISPGRTKWGTRSSGEYTRKKIPFLIAVAKEIQVSRKRKGEKKE